MLESSSLGVNKTAIASIDLGLLDILLKDRTTGKNIIWGTTDYALLGKEYEAGREILPPLITGEFSKLIQPRISKAHTQRAQRTKNRAEVFTPTWLCNEQNNMVDEAWFGRKVIFNIPIKHGWRPLCEKVVFPDKKGHTWQDYVDSTRLEITCGEAPYLVSRYDAVSGKIIDLQARIGLLDRKLRVINENVDGEVEWMEWTERAFQSVYGYEYQGDSLFLARKNLLLTFIDNMFFKFAHKPSRLELQRIATIISWNMWQMDGLTNCVPYCSELVAVSEGRASNCSEVSVAPTDVPIQMRCKIMDWRTGEVLEFSSLLKEDV